LSARSPNLEAKGSEWPSATSAPPFGAEPRRSRTAIRMRKVIAAGVLAVGVVVAVLIGIGSVVDSRSGASQSTYLVRRGNLLISVSTSGNVKARRSVDIKSKVERQTTIINIVPEGTYITQQDVDNGKILVELDASDLQEQLTQQEIAYASAEAGYAEATEAYQIQQNQNESDINKGKISVRFAMMDLQKYLGDALAQRVISMRDKEEDLIGRIAALIDSEQLGGEASQKLRQLEADIKLAEEELQRANDKLAGTQRLYERKYVSRNELEGDKLEVKRKEIALAKAKTALDLYKQYGFPKEATKYCSDHEEAQRELQRIQARAASKLAQAKAKLKSQEAAFKLQRDRLEKLKEQIAACKIKAPAVGLVAYGSSEDWWQRSRRPIEVGAAVHHRQKILRIPDTSEMAVEVQVHEAWVDKVKPNQTAKITIDAFPDKTFTGKVLKVAPLPTPHRWLDPDVKVYSTEVTIEGTNEFLKPGMSARVEIIVDELKNVLSVPAQAVASRSGRKVCYVITSNVVEQRVVQTGQFNESFIEIVAGLKEGERVLLNPPRAFESQEKAGAEPSQKASQEDSKAAAGTTTAASDKK